MYASMFLTRFINMSTKVIKSCTGKLAYMSSPKWRFFLAALIRRMIILGALFITGLRVVGGKKISKTQQTIYFANHQSHGDFVLIWAALPKDIRRLTRPVAGQDYWSKSSLRKFIGCDVFNSLLIHRDKKGESFEQLMNVLKAGDSLIIFPEGTRNTSDEVLLPFKSGLYHLSQQLDRVECVPVWIENLQRVLPKGSFLPVPLSCSIRFGDPLERIPNETKNDFLQRATQSLLNLRPVYDLELESDLLAQQFHANNLKEDR